jgi:ABC-2 type transport system ATP-binding protein
MDAVVFEAVSKQFQHRRAFIPWFGHERTGVTQALADVSLEAPANSVLALLGPNGSGKTTALKLISTMLIPDQGKVTVGGHDTQRAPEAVRRLVGFAVANERSFFPRLTARENLQFFAALDEVPKDERPRRITDEFSVTGLADAADTLVMKFSSGMYQRLGLARALLKNPSVLLLDEPTRSVDPGSAARFWSLVRDLPSRGTTVILATHNFQEAAAVADRVVVLHAGQIVGRRDLPSRDVTALRSFYFSVTGEVDEAAPAFLEPQP